MPEFDVKRRIAYGSTKKRKKKKQNWFVSVISGLLPWKGDSADDVIRKLIFLVSIIVLVVAVILIVNFYFFKDVSTTQELENFTAEKNQHASDDVMSIVIDDGETSSSTGTPPQPVEVLSEYVSFYEKNNNFVGWVSILPYINYPVVKCDDNEYYLKHNFYDQPTENGTIFADFRSTINSTTVSSNLILYGHNLITHNYFQPLSNYRSNIDFLKQNPTITFDTLYERGTYKIFSVFLTNTLEEHGEVFSYNNYIDFKSEAEFNEYVCECLDRSYYYTGVDLQYGDELLTLSTCDFSTGFSDMRLVVVARKVRENESPAMDTESFVSNTGFDENGCVKRKMFEAYYKTYTLSKGWAGRNWDTSLVKGLE